MKENACKTHTHTQTFAVCATVLLCQKSRWYVSVSVSVCVRARGCVTATGSGYISTLSSPPQRRHRSRVTFCVRFVLKTVCLRACTIARQDANVWSSLLSRWPLRHLRVHLWPDTLANFKSVWAGCRGCHMYFFQFHRIQCRSFSLTLPRMKEFFFFFCK